MAGGVPMGAYGMTEPVAALLRTPDEPAAAGAVLPVVATGGTLVGNALSTAPHELTRRSAVGPGVLADRRTGATGSRPGCGGFSRACRLECEPLGARAAYFVTPRPPTDCCRLTGCGRRRPALAVLLDLAIRGVWESGWWLGPTVSVEHTTGDVDTYLEVSAGLVSDLE